MVSSGTVLGDINKLKSTGNSYSSAVAGLSDIWQGKSHDNLVTKADSFLSFIISHLLCSSMIQKKMYFYIFYTNIGSLSKYLSSLYSYSLNRTTSPLLRVAGISINL